LWVLAVLSAGALGWAATSVSAVVLAGVQIDRLTATLALLVALVGAVTFRFARRYLLGEAGQARFLAWHGAAVVSAMLLMLSGNLILLWAAWTFTSIALHRLLTHYAHRPEALPPARKKFLISRLGDVALIAAILIVAFGYQTTDLNTFLAAAMQSPDAISVHAVAVLVVIAALTKSAQFPFHSWLPETMEAPTPVSALMHAGIINAGGALVLKFAPVLAAAPESLVLLVAVGVFTAILGMISMWAQTNIKRTLAWSTVSQMGFMMIQLGLCVFPAAVLHIVGHGFYKAWNFLASGWLPQQSQSKLVSPARHLSVVGTGALVSGGTILAFARVFGLDVLHHPGEAALIAVLALAIAQAWPIVLSSISVQRVGSVLAITLVASIIAVALYRGAAIFYAPVFELAVLPAGALGWAMGAIVVGAMIALIVTHALLPTLSRSTTGRAFRIHALHGFYCGAVADRIVRNIYSSALTSGAKAHA
jgi:formate hydrogenlyase subunit 3/multisubunit Na+/H+ antiporter MnhD subunit